MRQDDHHLDERELLLAIDRELPGAEQRRADEHLKGCDACREKRLRLMQVSALVAERLQGDAEDAQSVQQSRARLSVRLAEAARQQRQPAVGRVLGNLQRLAVPAAVIATAAAALLAVRLAGPAADLRGSGGSAVVHDAALPIPTLTPGATWTETAAELCSAAERERRDIPASVRDAVLRNYGMSTVSADDYELDYLITPELGGASDARNLWPQRYASGIWNAHVKDQLEDLLPGMVCEGRVPLQTAQHDIAVNWIAAYKRYFNTNVPLPRRLATAGRPDTRGAARYSSWRAADRTPLRLVAVSIGR